MSAFKLIGLMRDYVLVYDEIAHTAALVARAEDVKGVIVRANDPVFTADGTVFSPLCDQFMLVRLSPKELSMSEESDARKRLSAMGIDADTEVRRLADTTWRRLAAEAGPLTGTEMESLREWAATWPLSQDTLPLARVTLHRLLDAAQSRISPAVVIGLLDAATPGAREMHTATRAMSTARAVTVTAASLTHAPHCHATAPTPDRPDGGCICGAMTRPRGEMTRDGWQHAKSCPAFLHYRAPCNCGMPAGVG